MFCSKCGKEIFDEAVMCPHCGCAINNKIDSNAETEKTQNNDKSKKLGVAFIISGAINALISGVFSRLPMLAMMYSDYGLLGLYSYGTDSDIRNYDLAKTFGYIHEGLCVAGVILLILGIIFIAIKKPLVSKVTQTRTTVFMTIGLAVINLIVLIPFIVFKINY